MAKMLRRSLLFSFAWALGMASNFLLRSLPAATTSTVPVPPRKEEDSNGGVVMMAHNMTDDELLRQASMAPRMMSPKVAFMFLVRGDLPLAPLWERFFHGHRGLYSVYVHPDPSYAGSPDKGSVFYGRRVPSKEARWGRSSMSESERRLLANALLDAANQRFVLVSETCIPLLNFTGVYSYLMRSGATTSYVELFDAPGFHVRGRYSPAMAPAVTRAHWRKGSQWFATDRDLAREIVADETYFPVFQRHCRPPCVMDEHYVPTFIEASRWPGNANRTLTYARWVPGRPHPESFAGKDVTAELLRGIRTGGNCSAAVCYLFARKFLADALPELLRLAPKVMGFGWHPTRE